MMSNCSHHWMIQPAEGPVSMGTCRLCHEAREFQNSVDSWIRDSVPSPRYTPVVEGQLTDDE